MQSAYNSAGPRESALEMLAVIMVYPLSLSVSFSSISATAPDLGLLEGSG